MERRLAQLQRHIRPASARALPGAAGASASAAPPHELVIAGATVVDGTGAPGVVADVAVRAGKVVAIGSSVGPAAHTVDAAGLVLAPGIIDTHTHYDAQITWDRGCSPSVGLGVTTILMGNC